MFGISAFSQAPFSSLGGLTLFGQANVTADATVVSTALRIRTSDADVLAWVWDSVDKAEQEANVEKQLAELASPSKVTLSPAW